MTAPLFDPPPKPLTVRQQAALDHLPATSLEVGHHLHQLRGCRFCGPETPCQWAQASGQEVLTALRTRFGLVVRRKTGIWEAIQNRSSPKPGETPANSAANSQGNAQGDFPPGY